MQFRIADCQYRKRCEGHGRVIRRSLHLIEGSSGGGLALAGDSVVLSVSFGMHERSLSVPRRRWRRYRTAHQRMDPS